VNPTSQEANVTASKPGAHWKQFTFSINTTIGEYLRKPRAHKVVNLFTGRL